MHVVITGADGFVGRGLVDRLVREPTVLGRPISRLNLVDRTLPVRPPILLADEQATVAKVPCCEVVVLPGSTPSDSPWFKVFMLLQARPGLDAGALVAAWAEPCQAAVVAAPVTIGGYVRNVVLAVPGPLPAHHVIDEAWCRTEADARLIGALLFETARDRLDGAIVTDTTCMLLAREHVLHAGGN